MMDRFAPPDLSVIIVNRNTRELLRACLQSIAEAPDTIDLELIVVDNGSTDGSPEMVRREFTEVHLIQNPDNTGFAYPNNQGIAVSRGRHVMLLNSDTEVRPLAFERLVRFMDEHPEAGACGPALFYPDGRPQPSCRSFPTLRVHACDMLFLDRLFPRNRWFGNQETRFDHRHTAQVEQPMGAALLVRREVIDEVGTLDERFRIYYNDVDWCYRIHCAGWKIYFVHGAEVMHHQGVTTRAENRDLALTAEMVRNHFDFCAKHFGQRGLRWFRLLTLLGYGLRTVTLFRSPVVDHLARWRAQYRREMLRTAWRGYIADPEMSREAGEDGSTGPKEPRQGDPGHHLPVRA